VVALLEGIAERSGKSAALGALAVLRQILNWAVDRDRIDVNPAAAVKPSSILGKTERATAYSRTRSCPSVARHKRGR